MQESLYDMVNSLNQEQEKEKFSVMVETEAEEKTEIEQKKVVSSDTAGFPIIPTTNFYDWYESYSETIHGITRVKTEVSNVNVKDNIIFKVQKRSSSEEMELISFYNPSVRLVLNLPAIYLKVFKNDTFEVLHVYNDTVFIKSYGVKTGLIVVFCINLDGKIIPYKNKKIKKTEKGIPLVPPPDINNIRNNLTSQVDVEEVQLLYKQASKHLPVFTSKLATVEWFLKRQSEVIDINHLLKIDKVIEIIIT